MGVREIAQAAGVNLSTASYYFGGKAGLLAAIIDEANTRCTRILAEAGDDSTPAEEHVRRMAHALVRFFRENTELALVGFDAFPPADDANIVAHRVKWAQAIDARLTGLYRKLGLDVNDPVQMGVVLHSLPMTVMTFFESIFAVEQCGASSGRAARARRLDDAFFEHYAEHLTELFLYGVTGMMAMSQGQSSAVPANPKPKRR